MLVKFLLLLWSHFCLFPTLFSIPYPIDAFVK
jgi:hypothetical protein